MRALGLVCLLFGCGASASVEVRDPSERWPGGATSVEEVSSRSFSLPARNLDADRRAMFAVGNNLFADNWVTAPSSTSARDGLGPRFDATSCSGCHLHDGRGRIEEDGSIISAVVRVSSAEGGVHPAYGSQLQRHAVLGLNVEGGATVRAREVDGLRAFDLVLDLPLAARPSAGAVTPEGSGPRTAGDAARADLMDRTMRTSLRVAPQLLGLGLLEAIEERAILAHADPDDADGDGISGRANRVMALRERAMVLGRIGWKANQADVESQVAAALAGDLGITSRLVPVAECAAADQPCRDVPSGGEPEISDEQLGFLVLYARTLAVPAARDFDDREVLRGRSLFTAAGCPRCHVPSFTTGESDIAALAHQRIWPYTDLLLHDMGEGLADGRDDGEATGSEWRTPPLWGIGLIERVNGHSSLLHDGRARSLDEAVRWHGGEGDTARRAYEALSSSERAALVRFVASI